MCRTDPADVQRSESCTWLCTRHEHTSVPRARRGVAAECGRWMSEEQLARAIADRFPGCMSGRIMYVVRPVVLVSLQATVRLVLDVRRV